MMQLIYLAFTKPRKDSVAFISTIEKQKAFIQNRGNDPDQVFRDSISCFMNGYHYTSIPTTEADLKKLDQNVVMTYSKNVFLILLISLLFLLVALLRFYQTFN